MVAKIVILEGLTSFTAKAVKEFIGSDAAKKGIGWFTGNKLDEIFGDEQTSKLLKEKLGRIHQEFEDIKKETSKKLTVETDWEHCNTRIFHAEMDICHKFQLLQLILANKESPEKRGIEVERLQNGILDTNSGVLNNLAVIHQVLVGQNENPTKKGLLELWSKGLVNNMLENPMSAKTCYDYFKKYLTKTAILQLKGFLLFKGANDNTQFCSDHFKLFEKNLASQSNLMDTSLPKIMKYLTNPSEENVFYLRPVSRAPFKPFVKRQGEGKQLLYEYCLENIAEEKWNFEESSTFNKDGSLYISGISNSNNGTKRSYIGVNDNNKAICVSKEGKPQPFYVMPLYKETSMNITICKPNPKPDSSSFLGNSLEFMEKEGSIEFTMTEPAKITEKEKKWKI